MKRINIYQDIDHMHLVIGTNSNAICNIPFTGSPEINKRLKTDLTKLIPKESLDQYKEITAMERFYIEERRKFVNQLKQDLKPSFEKYLVNFKLVNPELFI